MDQPLSASWNWRAYFDTNTLTLGKKLVSRGHLVRFTVIRSPEATASGEFVSGHRCKCRAPSSYSDCTGLFAVSADEDSALRSDRALKLFTCNCPDAASSPCAHMAAVLFHWESERGSFRFRETAAEQKVRTTPRPAPSAAASARPAPQISLSASSLPPAGGKAAKPAPASSQELLSSFFADLSIPSSLYFDPFAVIGTATATEASVREAGAQLGAVPALRVTPTISYESSGLQELQAKVESESMQVRFYLTRQGVRRMTCQSCHTSYSSASSSLPPVFCAHELLAYRRLIAYLIQFRPGDATNRSSDTLIRAMYGSSQKEESSAVKNVDLQACVRMFRDGYFSTPVRLRQSNGNFHEPASCTELLQSIEKRTTCFFPGGAVDFSRHALAASSLPLFQLLLSATRSDPFHPSNLPGIPWPILSGHLLDRFYDLYAGSLLPILSRADEVVGHMGVGTRPDVIELTLSLSEEADQMVLLLEGTLPFRRSGENSTYLLPRSGKSLIRVPEEDAALVDTLYTLSDASGSVRCVFGCNRLIYFRQEVYPRLRALSVLRLRDCLPEGCLDSLSDDMAFTFYLNRVSRGSGHLLTCRMEVAYGSTSYPLPYRDRGPEVRDAVHEEFVMDAVTRFFPQWDDAEEAFSVQESGDVLYDVLHDGLDRLKNLGQVMVSQHFPSLSMRSVSAFQVSVSVDDGGLLGLSVLSPDLDAQELLALLEDYRARAHYHRLRNGEFVDLRAMDQQMNDVLELAARADVRPEELFLATARLPRARAFLLNALFEKTSLASRRDDYFDRLIASFSRMREADIQPPVSLENVMHPYQKAGFSWMRMLAEGGFGGILADDMGLGKTLQMLAFLLSLREQGEKGPYLIVCPASLVYNWQEEVRRFTPTLSCQPLTGTQAQREEILRALSSGAEGCADIYVASYDIVRRDILFLQSIAFTVAVLDEGQYIKNTKTGTAKAVKVLSAKYRFALTGTPIENRLSELWSIFDFLMPGFLFSYETFRVRFDIPITIEQDPQATELLSRMTSPFILRRLKQDVLLELPEKLEEVRMAAFTGRQRELYDAQVLHTAEVIRTSKSMHDRFQVLSELLRLRQICCDPSLVFPDYTGESAKRAACMDLIQSAIDGGHRILLFSQFTSMLDLLSSDLTAQGIPFYTLTGSTPKETRIRLVHDFNVGDTPVFLISLKAGGTGLNLTGADVVIHYDPWWNLAAQNQATDRAHRIGQTRQVTVFRLIATGTIEERILQLQEKKKDLADAILEGSGESLLTLSSEDLLALVEENGL